MMGDLRHAPEVASPRHPGLDWATSQLPVLARRMMVVVAHPDDETIGLGGQLHRLHGIQITLVTDGAPADRAFWPAGVGNRLEYAALRRAEFMEATDMAGVTPDALTFFGVMDLAAGQHMPAIARRLAEMWVERHTRIVITHAYEGGHPDHDATALAVHCAARLLQRRGLTPPILIETGYYHARRQHPVFGELPLSGGPITELRLSGPVLMRKRRMLRTYVTQASVLASFDASRESFRPAAVTDFTQLPNEGELLYGHFGFPLREADLITRNRAALIELGLSRFS